MEGMPQGAVCEENPGGRGQREAWGNKSICASTPPWRSAKIYPGSCRCQVLSPGPLVSRSEMFPHLPGWQKLKNPGLLPSRRQAAAFI